MYSARPAKAITELRKGLDVCREYSINLLIPAVVGQLGAALTAVGSHDQAIRLARPHGGGNLRCSATTRTAFANYALAAAYRGERPAARRRSIWSSHARECDPLRTSRHPRCGLLHLLGVLKGDQGDPAAAGSAAVALDRNLPGRWEAMATIAQGQLALASIGRKPKFDRAGRSADAAISIYQRLGCDALAQKAQAMRQIKFGTRYDFLKQAPSENRPLSERLGSEGQR